jgi:hypothetical protein
MQNVIESLEPAQISASANICARKGRLGGIFVSSAAATPTITIYDDSASGTGVKLVDTFTPVAGTYYKLPFNFLKGCNIVLTGTVSLTAAFEGA